MAKMLVEGGVESEVPQHLDGIVAADYPRRILARIIDLTMSALVYVIFFLLPILLVAGAVASADESTTQTLGTSGARMWMIGSIVLLILGLIQFILLLSKGRTLGMLIMGVRYVRMSDGRISPLAALGKGLLEGLLGAISCGLAPIIIWFVSKDEHNRHWFSRKSGLLTINTRSGRDSARTPAPPAPLPTTPEAVIAGPWRASSEPPLSTPSTIVTPPWDTPVPPLALVDDTPPPAFSPPPVNHPAMTPPTRTEDTTVGAFPPPLTSAPPAPTAPSSHPAAPLASTSNEPLVTEVPGVERDNAPTLARRPLGVKRLTFDDGSEFFLAGKVLIGRDPEALTHYPDAELLPLADPGMSISKTHLALSVHADGVLVEDLRSTNGSRIALPTGATQPLAPGISCVAPLGSTIHFGDRTVLVSV